MVDLPDREAIIDANINTGVWKTLYQRLRDFITQMPGGSTLENIAVENGTFSPKSAFVAISPEGSADSDIVETIKTTNIPDGQCIFLAVQSDGDQITLKHNFGGQGTIFLFQNKDLVLTKNFSILLLRTGSAWVQINTSGYLFTEDGLIDNGLLFKGTNQKEGLVRFSTDDEYSNGSLENVAVNPKQVKGTVEAINKSILDKIYPISLYQKSKETGANIQLEDNIFIYLNSISGTTTFTFDKSMLTNVDNCMIFQLILDMKNVSTVNFPSNVSWLYNVAPTMNLQKKYLLAFMTTDGGLTWVGNLQGYW